jgi:DNA-binding transcriptional regulator/RsmH inhibitor MraZ
MPSGDFLGSAEVSVYKQRFMLPTQFQKKLSPAAKQTFVLTKGTEPNTLVMYPLDNWNLLIQKLKNGSDEDQGLLIELYDYAMTEQALEGPGRLKICSDLLAEAAIQDTAIIKGDGSYLTIITPENLAANRLKRKESNAGRFSKQQLSI